MVLIFDAWYISKSLPVPNLAFSLSAKSIGLASLLDAIAALAFISALMISPSLIPFSVI